MSRRFLSVAAALVVLAAGGCRERAVPQAQPGAAVAEAVAPAGAGARSFGMSALEAAQWTGKPCNLDMIDRGPPDAALATAQPHLFEGFLVGPDGRPGGDFQFVLKGATSAFAIPGATGVDRPDVAEYFKDPSLADAGFAFTASLAGVPAGEYQPVLVLGRDGAMFFCETGRRVVVR